MDSVKYMMGNSVQKEIKSFIEDMNKIQRRIDSANNISELYSLVASIHDYSLEKDGLGVRVLQEGLTNDFFVKENKGVKVLNGITFENNDYIVFFSSNQLKHIKITDKNPVRKQLSHDIRVRENLITANKRMKAVIPYIEIYLQKPNLSNTRKLISKLRLLTTYTNGNFTDYTIVKDIDWIEELESIKKNVKATKTKIENIDKMPELHKERQDNYILFINSLTDLDQFKENGWTISTSLDDEYHEFVPLLNK